MNHGCYLHDYYAELKVAGCLPKECSAWVVEHIQAVQAVGWRNALGQLDGGRNALGQSVGGRNALGQSVDKLNSLAPSVDGLNELEQTVDWWIVLGQFAVGRIAQHLAPVEMVEGLTIPAET